VDERLDTAIATYMGEASTTSNHETSYPDLNLENQLPLVLWCQLQDLVADAWMTQPKNVTITMRKLPVLNAWESRTMSEFDWRSPETYARLQTAEAADFAWECLRRNSDYQDDYRIRQNSGKMHEIAGSRRDTCDLLGGKASGRDGLIVSEATATALVCRTQQIIANPPRFDDAELGPRYTTID
jgi:hypothetical protein